MVRLRFRTDYILGGAFLLSLLLSLLFYFVAREPLARRTLFFPSMTGPLLSGEDRLLPVRQGQEANLRLLVDELILGPARSSHLRVLPRRTRVESLLLRRGSLYLNLSREALFQEEDGMREVTDALQAVGNTIWYNFPRLRHVHIFIDGQVPHRVRGGEAAVPGGVETGEVRFLKSALR